MNNYDLKNKHAVITGGASGIGFAIAQRMVASGATVTLWDRDAEALSRAASQLGTAAKAVQLDLADHPQVVKATADTVAHSPNKTIDILVNSAGITGPNETLAKYPIDAWHQVMQINLNALFYCCREIVPVMQANDSGKGYGRIVNIASVAGKEGNPNASAYGASKGAVMTLTKALGKELAATGIRVNCVTPAAVDSPMFSQMKPEFIQYMLSKIPMARFGQADEVAAMVTWLSSEDCSFSTGAVFDISGGRATY
jgi:2-dehydro-3-deoxy-L-rhamnonate dehydrogenase (NAD+)